MTDIMQIAVEITRKAGESKSMANCVHATPKMPKGYARTECNGEQASSTLKKRRELTCRPHVQREVSLARVRKECQEADNHPVAKQIFHISWARTSKSFRIHLLTLQSPK